MSDYEEIIDLCEIEDNKPVYKKSSFKIVDYVMFCIGSGFILLFLYTTGFLYLPIIQMINTAKLYALDNTTEIESLFIFSPPPLFPDNTLITPEYQMVRQSHILNTDFIEEKCEKIKEMNRLLDIRHDLADEFEMSVDEVDIQIWANEARLSEKELMTKIHDSRLAKHDLMIFNRRILSKWLLSKLPSGQLPLYDMIEFVLNEIVIAIDLYDPDIHGDYSTYIQYFVEDNYYHFYEKFIIEGNEDISHIGNYISPHYILYQLNMNIAFSLVKLMIQQCLFNVFNNTKNTSNKMDNICLIENTIHPVEFNMLMIELGFVDDRSMSIEEISEMMQMTPDTLLDIIYRSMKKIKIV